MFPEMFVGIVQDVAVEFPRAPVGVDVLVRAALGEVDTVAAEKRAGGDRDTSRCA